MRIIRQDISIGSGYKPADLLESSNKQVINITPTKQSFHGTRKQSIKLRNLAYD